jgi:hypothetical protein
MSGRALLAVLIMTLGVFAARAEIMSTPDLAPGKEWSIKSPSPTTAKVIIDRVEPWQEKTVVRVSIIDLPIPQSLPRAGGTTAISHMPFERSALAGASVGAFRSVCWA